MLDDYYSSVGVREAGSVPRKLPERRSRTPCDYYVSDLQGGG
jgi:hypothetical protein